jgi:hypothetical protein
MSDTRPEVAEQYRRLLLSRSGEERLKMGSSMHATARALIRASVLERNPLASADVLRRELFLRLYGNEFDAETQERILARLGLDPSPRKLAVNWDDLEMALMSNPAEWSCYFDVRTGEVQMRPGAHLGMGGDWPSEEEIDAGLETGRLIPIEPLGSSIEYGWMAEFTDTVRNPGFRDLLDVALAGRGAFRRFKDILHGGGPSERERWFAFRDERIWAAGREWLAQNGIAAANPPPRKQ